MPVPFLVPAIGALVGTAAAPALGMSAALAAGLGGGIATLAAGGDVKEALLAGATAGVGSALMPALTSGVAGAAGQGAKAAAQGATQSAAQAAPQMAKSTIAQNLAQQPTVANISGQVAEAAAGKGLQLNPEKAMEMGLRMAGGGQEQRQTAPASAAPMMAPSMSLGGGSVSSAGAMERFDQLQPQARPGVPSAQLQTPGVESVVDQPGVDPRLIPLQMGRFANGGLASMAQAEMQRRGMRSLPNLGDREQAYMMARQEFARGGYIEGPGTGTSDDIPATIYQNGQPVGEALLSDGEVVLSHKDLATLDPKGNSERAGQKLGNAGNGNRGRMAAQMFLEAEKFRERAA